MKLSAHLSRLSHRLRFRFYGYRAGLGQPVPTAALDREYATGGWDHFFGPDELTRHEVLVGLIRAAQPKPRLLDLGCGSGRLTTLLDPAGLGDYLGVDISSEALTRARTLGRPLPLARFEQHDFETWSPAGGAFDVITFNECLGYATDPLRTACRFHALLPPGGTLLVSHFRSTNHVEFWRRLARAFDYPMQHIARSPKGQVWDIRSLRLRS